MLADKLIYFERAINPHDFARIVAGWIRDSVIIVDEFEEVLKGPNQAISEIERKGWTTGDCDCVAMLGAALTGSIGASVRFRAIQPQPDGSFAHVFTEISFPRDEKYYPFDPTINCVPIWQGDSITVDVVT